MWGVGLEQCFLLAQTHSRRAGLTGSTHNFTVAYSGQCAVFCNLLLRRKKLWLFCWCIVPNEEARGVPHDDRDEQEEHP